MKHVFLIFTIILLLASCSQKQFTFRKKINVNKAEIVVLKSPQNDVVSASKSAKLSNDNLVETYNQPLPFIEQTNALSAPSIYVLPDDTIRKKYKFGDNKTPSDSLKNDQSNNTYKAQNDASDKDAMIGFFLGLGALLMSILAIPGLIFSIKGLKSKNKKGFAIAGLVLSSLMILFVLFIILLFIMILNSLSRLS